MRLRPVGDTAVLVELGSTQEVLAWYAAARAAVEGGALGGVGDLVPAARTVLVLLAEGADRAAVSAAVRRVRPATREAAGRRGARPVVEVPVIYDGPDLADVARHTGLSERAVVDAHTGSAWTVAFCGFAPGFGYLVGGDPRLVVPRRHQPRTRVPAGAVGLAGEFSGVYPRASPGGWQLIGHTDLVVWDADRQPPALLVPGTAVRFVEAG